MTELDAARISTASSDHQYGDGWCWYETGNGTVRWGRRVTTQPGTGLRRGIVNALLIMAAMLAAACAVWAVMR